MTGPLILSIDQGTTSTRALVFDVMGHVRATARREHQQIYPASGWVEHDPEEIWAATLAVIRAALAAAGGPVVAFGLTNQRETCVLWDARTGAPLMNAIVWQDRRTADSCAALRAAGFEDEVIRRTGLRLDPYFSATKIAWMLDRVPGARARAERGELRAGTIDSFLLWRLTGGRVHATDATNAARTLLYNIHDGCWDPWLMARFGVPLAILPEVRDSAADFGLTDPALFGTAFPIAGVAGDQQAAMIGQACFTPGMVKATYGTGAFILLNTGAEAVRSQHRLLTTIAYRLGGRVTYALEGSIFHAGSTVQWLRDGLKVIGAAAETEGLARSLAGNNGVYVVPAFSGLGAPHWAAEARGVLSGLTGATGAAELARAALEAVAYQTRDLLATMMTEFAGGPEVTPVLRADGGMTANRWLMQFLADMVGAPVDAAAVAETTALGAAALAGLQVGVFDDLDDLARRWRRAGRFTPNMPAVTRDELYAGWRQALARALL